METLISASINGVKGDQHGLEVDGGRSTPGEIDIHTAARHGTAETVERLSQQLADSGGEVGGLRRGVVDSTPVHDAAATGNMATLACLLAATGSKPCSVYLSLFVVC